MQRYSSTGAAEAVLEPQKRSIRLKDPNKPVSGPQLFLGWWYDAAPQYPSKARSQYSTKRAEPLKPLGVIREGESRLIGGTTYARLVGGTTYVLMMVGGTYEVCTSWPHSDTHTHTPTHTHSNSPAAFTQVAQTRHDHSIRLAATAPTTSAPVDWSA